MRPAKTAGVLTLVVLAGLLLTYGTMRLGLWNSDPTAMRQKYAAAPDTFVKIDGVDVHVSDEGHGPVVVMLHGSILNLHEWDPVVTRLKSRYRIIRLDWPPYGISGIDPTGIYSTQRAADLLAGLVEHLGLTDFSLVATSNGADIALQFAADHPAHVRAMAFSILPLQRPSQHHTPDPIIVWLAKFHAAWLPDYHSKLWYSLILKDTTSPNFHPPAALVDMMYDLDNLPGAAVRQRAFIAGATKLFSTTDVGALAGQVHVPVLLQWCALDTVISQSASDSVARFTHTQVELITYPDIGHFPMWEDPDRFSADLGRFLDRVTAPASSAPP